MLTTVVKYLNKYLTLTIDHLELKIADEIQVIKFIEDGICYSQSIAILRLAVTRLGELTTQMYCNFADAFRCNYHCGVFA
jgi:hypothetical protein